MTIEEKWLDFMRAVKLGDAPEIQRVQMKRAFFAGFASALGVVAKISDETPDENLDAGADQLDQLLAEVFAFGERGGI